LFPCLIVTGRNDLTGVTVWHKSCLHLHQPTPACTGMTASADNHDLVRANSAAAERYEEDLLLANWNPAVAVLAAFRDHDRGDNERGALAAAIGADPDGFLDRVYALASRI
jgi:hypothetical protein